VAEHGTELRRESLHIDVSGAVALEGKPEIAADVVWPCDGGVPPRALLFCLPGGFLDRTYFDLAASEDSSYSFAEFMARRGYVVAAIDHIGCGASSRPADMEDGYTLGVDAITAANECARAEIAQRVASELGAGELVSVGVGHSMGSLLSVAQQANHAPHAALVLQSFSTQGLRGFLQGDEASFADDAPRAHAGIAELARARFGTPYPIGTEESEEGTTAAFSAGTAPDVVYRYLHNASTNLLGVPGLLTMIPGAYAPYAEKVAVPVFVGGGDHDLGRAHSAATMLPAAPEVLAFELPDCWHCHNVANTRQQMWQRIDLWLGSILERPDAAF
jgi:alpha-beta hydrolase superfamily lysophospholipase